MGLTEARRKQKAEYARKYQQENREKRTAYRREWRKKNCRPGTMVWAAARLRWLNGWARKKGVEPPDITKNQLIELYKEHDKRCDICGLSQENNGNQLSIDHNHKTGKVRGFLCHYCNHGLGLFEDSPHLLEKAKKYLELNQ